MKLCKKLAWSTNLESTYVLGIWCTTKILYRSFWDKVLYKNKIYEQLMSYNFHESITKNIQKIFSISELDVTTFHFWEDIETWRVKFYISLYDLSFKQSLKILTQVKKILNIQKYYLNQDFLKFDCIWFDIYNESITLKVYELVHLNKVYFKNLPDKIEKWNIKEVGVLKSWERNKIFFRFNTPINISTLYPEILRSIEIEQHSYKSEYVFQNKITYYCCEWDKQEIYFI